MQLQAEKVILRLQNPFTLSYGTTTTRENVAVRLRDGAYTGVGEAAVVPYYGQTPEHILAYFSDPALIEALGGDPFCLEDLLDRLPPGPAPARAAVDMALHDLWGQCLGQPLYRLWGLNPARCPLSSFTVGMADNETAYRKNLRAAQHFTPLIKLKLGSGDWQADLRLVHIARDETGAPLYVDANAGWSVEDAQAIIPRLMEMGVLLVEQPLARDNLDGWRALRAALPANHPPLIADESVQGVESVPPLAGLVDGINIKLAKCGGLRAARQMIALARAYGLRVMVGCMVESSAAVTAAAQLAPLADYADLDGNLLIANDPFRGVRMEAGRLALPGGPGLGLTQE